jgi:hypothetical protein
MTLWYSLRISSVTIWETRWGFLVFRRVPVFFPHVIRIENRRGLATFDTVSNEAGEYTRWGASPRVCRFQITTEIFLDMKRTIRSIRAFDTYRWRWMKIEHDFMTYSLFPVQYAISNGEILYRNLSLQEWKVWFIIDLLIMLNGLIIFTFNFYYSSGDYRQSVVKYDIWRKWMHWQYVCTSNTLFSAAVFS